jgi:hypothetical protein
LSFKIIFIQKSQISIFGKYLNLFEFENLFDLNFNFGFNFKTAEKKFKKNIFLIFFSAHFSFRPRFPCSPVRFPLFLLFLFSCRPISPSSPSGPASPPGHPAYPVIQPNSAHSLFSFLRPKAKPPLPSRLAVAAATTPPSSTRAA